MYKSRTKAYRLVYQRTYIAKNREKVLAYRRGYYKANRARLKAQQKASDKRYPARIRATRKRYYDAHPEMFLLTSARARAKANKLPFNLCIEDVRIPEFCPVFGIRLVRGDRIAAPSLDRFVPLRGYIRGNVSVISRRANELKNDASVFELCALAAWIRRAP